jgi:Sulfatase
MAARFIGQAMVALCLASLASPAGAEDTKPNIVIILADDLGNADLGYRGSDIKTPNIDKLAEGGVRLEDFYGMPVCTPARAELMTGRYAMRYGLETLVIFPSHTFGLATDERTLPQALKDAGYDTAMVGKWHLGMPIRNIGRKTAASIISTAILSARWTTSPRSAAGSSTGNATAPSGRRRATSPR